MTHDYIITGLTCNNCVAKAKSALLSLGDITEASVQLAAPQATITMQHHIPLATLQEALSKKGHYQIRAADHQTEIKQTWLETYKPVLLVEAFLLGITLIIEWKAGGFVWQRWMEHFMAGFFLTFSFFKLLDINGFANSYASYDILAKAWPFWGKAYPFVELLLGLGFISGIRPLLVNGASFVVMALSIIGVVQSLVRKRKIECACLGSVFNLPMSTITLVEDALMLLMSAIMILNLI